MSDKLIIMDNQFKRRRRQTADKENTKKCKIQRATESMMVDHSELTWDQRTTELNKTNKLFNPKKLREALLPTLKKINRNDCPKAISTGLSTIEGKLTSEEYLEPWQYVEDVWLMFESARSSLSNTSQAYEFTTELSEEFDQAIDPVMRTLGYCCGRNYVFDPQALCCSGKMYCTIQIDAVYYSYKTKFLFCEKCVRDIPGDAVTIDAGSPSESKVQKDQFIQMKNDITTLEPFIDCRHCGRKLHQICVLYLKENWPNGFVCETCMTTMGATHKERTFNAKNLPRTKVDSHIEARLTNFLTKRKVNAGHVHIRMLCNSDDVIRVKPRMRNLFVESGEMNAEFPYRSKALFAFQEIDGADVCFFGLFVQEYGSECAHPNAGRVYMTCLDSVNFFEPRQYRTSVYHEILLGYMDFVKQLGYSTVHIWACPPPIGQNYIFYCRPPTQKRPNAEMLVKWYKTMFKKGKSERIIDDFMDIFQQAKAVDFFSATELPYFDEDFWPYFLEQSINTFDGKLKVKAKKKRAYTKRRTPCENDTNVIKRNNVNANLLATMKMHKKVFLVAQLRSTQSAAKLPPIQDPDALVNVCDLMKSNDAFFNFTRDYMYEFSSLRRARFSTMRILYELHNPGRYRFVYICNNCNDQLETRYHCRVCDDYDLCVDCQKTIGHVHKMDKMGLDDENESHQRLLQSYVHVGQCRNSNCPVPLCSKMKIALDHAKFCQLTKDDCKICKQLNGLFACHAKDCQIDINCPYSFCRNAKMQQVRQRLRGVQMIKLLLAEEYLKNFNDIVTNRNPMTSSSDNLSALMEPEAAASHQKLLNTVIKTVLNARTYFQEIIRIVNGPTAKETTSVLAASSTVLQQIGRTEVSHIEGAFNNI